MCSTAAHAAIGDRPRRRRRKYVKLRRLALVTSFITTCTLTCFAGSLGQGTNVFAYPWNLRNVIRLFELALFHIYTVTATNLCIKSDIRTYVANAEWRRSNMFSIYSSKSHGATHTSLCCNERAHTLTSPNF